MVFYFEFHGGRVVKKLRAEVALLLMILSGIVGFFAGSALGNALLGAALFAFIAGITCVVYVIDNQNK